MDQRDLLVRYLAYVLDVAGEDYLDDPRDDRVRVRWTAAELAELRALAEAARRIEGPDEEIRAFYRAQADSSADFRAFVPGLPAETDRLERERDADSESAKVARRRKEAIDRGEMGTTSLEDMIAEFAANAEPTVNDVAANAARGRERALALHYGAVALLRDADADELDSTTRDRLRAHAAVLSAWFEEIAPALLDAGSDNAFHPDILP